MIFAWSRGLLGRFEEATANAYVRAGTTSVTPKVSCYVIDVNVIDNASVEAVRIDDSNYKARLAQADAKIGSGRAAW